jgi:hypothetical protein
MSKYHWQDNVIATTAQRPKMMQTRRNRESNGCTILRHFQGKAETIAKLDIWKGIENKRRRK